MSVCINTRACCSWCDHRVLNSFLSTESCEWPPHGCWKLHPPLLLEQQYSYLLRPCEGFFKEGVLELSDWFIMGLHREELNINWNISLDSTYNLLPCQLLLLGAQCLTCDPLADWKLCCNCSAVIEYNTAVQGKKIQIQNTKYSFHCKSLTLGPS